MTLTLRTDRSLVRAAGHSTRHLHVVFSAPEARSRADRPALSVAFVLDRSGSMAGEKIAVARRAVVTALSMLKAEDSFSVIVHDDRVDVLVAATPASGAARRLAAERLASVDARGGTDLSTGWLRGCEQVAHSASPDRTVRCLLISDGLANRGITDAGVLAARASQLRTSNIVTSTFGVGRDFDERLMASLAHAGGGNFYYVEHARQIEDVLTSELGEVIQVVARRPAVELELPVGVEAELKHECRSTVEGRRMRIELDDLVSGQEVSLIVKLRFPSGDPGSRAAVHGVVSSEDGVLGGESEITWMYADHPANDAQPRDRSVDRAVAQIYAARARRLAVEQNRGGDYQGALELLDRTGRRVQMYAGTDAELNEVAASLAREARVFGSHMKAADLKLWHMRSRSEMKMRDEAGYAKRRNPERS